ncbi:MAG: hypothetical protein L0220_14845 [Acidobacteria bacterium]|nr:hypothetical protein [Acidobacteriota bacterium]
MHSLRVSSFLRWVLFADSATCIAAGLLMLLGSGQLGQYLGLPASLLSYAGISLLPFTAFLVYLATRENLSPAVLWTVIVLNLLWTVDSILLLFSGWVTPTEPGYLFVIAQAVGVAVFAVLEYFGLRKSTTVMIVPT